MKKEDVKNRLMSIRSFISDIENNLEGNSIYQDQMCRNLENVIYKIDETLICNDLCY